MTLEPSAAAVRSGVERGDPYAVLEGVALRERERLTYLPAFLAATSKPVAVDRDSLAAGELGESLALAGNDLAAMEHKRQSRLRSYQRLPPERKVNA